MAGTGISEGLIGMDAQSGWPLISGSQLGSQLEPSGANIYQGLYVWLEFLTEQ